MSLRVTGDSGTLVPVAIVVLSSPSESPKLAIMSTEVNPADAILSLSGQHKLREDLADVVR